MNLLLYGIVALAILGTLSGIAYKVRESGYEACKVEWQAANAEATAAAELERKRQESVSRDQARTLEAKLAKQRRLNSDLANVVNQHISRIPPPPAGCPVPALTPELLDDANRALAGPEGPTPGSLPDAGGTAAPAGRSDDGKPVPEAAGSGK